MVQLLWVKITIMLTKVINMKSILLIITISLLKSIADIIRVPAVMKDSVFAKYVGHGWIDPEIAWQNKYVLGWLGEPFISLFSDLWHTCNTLMILLFLCLPFVKGIQEKPWKAVLIYFAVYGIAFNIFYKILIFL